MNPTLSHTYPFVNVVDVLNCVPSQIEDNSTLMYLNNEHIKGVVHRYAVEKWDSLTPEEKNNNGPCINYIENYKKTPYNDIIKPMEKSVQHHENQIDAGGEIVENYKDPSVYSNEVKVSAEMGSGKSNLISYVAYLLQTSTDLYDRWITPRIKNTFLITGWSDSEYVDTMAQTMFTIPKENIFHLNTIRYLGDRINNDKTLLYGMVIFIDEARLVVQKDQTIWNMFNRLGLLTNGKLDREILIKFDIKIVYVDATLDTHWLADIPSIYMKNGPNYKGTGYFLPSMTNHRDYDINKQEGFRNLVNLFKIPDNLNKTHMLRLSNNEKSVALKNELERIGYRVFNDFSNTSTSDGDYIDNIINNPRTVIIVKGKYRCSKRFRLKPNIGIVYEILTKEPSDPTVTQSLPARFFGYYDISDLFQVCPVFIVNTECYYRYLQSLETGQLEGDYNSGLVGTKNLGPDDMIHYLKKATYNQTETTQEEKLTKQHINCAREGILTSGSENLCHHSEIPDNDVYDNELRRIRNVPDNATVENWAEYYPTAEEARARLRSLGANVTTAGNNTQALNVNDNGRLSMFSNFDIGERAIREKFSEGQHIVYRINKTDDNRFQLRWIIKVPNWMIS